MVTPLVCVQMPNKYVTSTVAASRNRREYGGIVPLRFALLDAIAHELRINLCERQLLPTRLRVVEHQREVLIALIYAACRVLKLASRHQRSLGIHDLRIGCRVAQHSEKWNGIEPHFPG